MAGKMSREEKEAELEGALRDLEDSDGYPLKQRSEQIYAEAPKQNVRRPSAEESLRVPPELTNRPDQRRSAKGERLEWRFVHEHDDNDKILCKICMDVLLEPHLITCCGECACSSCFDRHWQTESLRCEGKKRCPFCREERFRLIGNSDLKREINKLKVYCIHAKKGCLWSGRLQDGESHINECIFCPVNCPNGCGCDKFEKRYIGSHLAECPMQIVGCSFEQIGCTSNHLPRKEVAVHSTRDIHHHLILLAKSNIKLYEESDVTLAALHSNRDEVVKEKQEVINSRKQELTTLDQTIQSLEGNLLELKQNLKELKENANANMMRCFSKLKASADEAKGLHVVCALSLTEVQALPIPQASGISCLPVTFTVDQFSIRKRNSDHWMSAPFYTHCGGYKMCLSVYPNGLKEAKGRFVSVFFHMMSGEFDDYLTWPFPGAVINISTLSQRKAVVSSLIGTRGNFGADIDFFGEGTRDDRSRVFDGSYGPGSGRQKYIPHNLVSQYLAEDSLKIMVFHIQFIPF